MENQVREKRWRKLAPITFAAILMLAGVSLAGDEAPDVAVEIERVALFKNGLGYFTSSAALPKGATTINIGQIPVPSNGTFWLGYPESLKVRAMITSMVDVEEAFSPRNVAELLQANPGRKVTLRTNLKDAPAITGTIVKVVSNDKPTPPSPYIMDVRRVSPGYGRRPWYGNSVIIIKTETGTVSLNAGSVIRADFGGDDITATVSVVSKKPSIRLELNKASRGQKVGLSYLARGITWSPSYMIDITDPKTAKFSAKAIVINEAADLRGVHLDLVTGFPNIQFGEVNSPVAMSQNLEGFLRSLTRGRSESNRRRGHTMQRQAMLRNMPMYADNVGAPVPGYSTARKGIVSE
ncbi:MAG: hypothetical protein DRP83_06425, partial [Planctomycetota bacterium]